MTKLLRIDLLGAVRICSLPDGRLIDAPGSRHQLLLAHLAHAPGKLHQRRQLAEKIWHGRGEEQARASLRHAIWSLRNLLGEGAQVLRVSAQELGLDSGLVSVDVHEFEAFAKSNEEAELARAVALYRGDYLEDFDLGEIDPSSGLFLERQRLRGLATNALVALSEALRERGAFDAAVDAGRQLLSLDALDEAGHRALILAHGAAGNPRLARAQYDQCRQLLLNDLQVAPSQETQVALRQSIGGLGSPRPAPVAETNDEAARETWRSSRRSRFAGLVAVTAVAVAALLQILPTSTGHSTASDDGLPTLAVLPFEDISLNNQQALYAAGLTTDLITDLSKISGLRVIAQDSVRTAGGKSSLDIATTLGIDYLVRGSVRRSRGLLRINAQLVEAATGRHLWSERYDRRMEKLFEVQHEVIHGVTSALSIPLTDSERARLTIIPTSDLRAYDHFMRARELRLKGPASASTAAALASFAQAVEVDPDFAAAHAGLAHALLDVWRFDLNDVMAGAVALEMAYQAAGKALELAPGNASAHVALSVIQSAEGASAAALDSARRATTLEPNDAQARVQLALLLALQGDLSNAEAQLEVARKLHPTASAELEIADGIIAFEAEDYGRASERLALAERNGASGEVLYVHLAATHAYLGQIEAAQAAKGRVLASFPFANLNYYRVVNRSTRSPASLERLIEGLRRAGMPEWPFGFTADGNERIEGEELRSLATDATWRGQTTGGGSFIAEIDQEGLIAYRSERTLLLGEVRARGAELCQRLDGYLLGREHCGFVIRGPEDEDGDAGYVFVAPNSVRSFALD